MARTQITDVLIDDVAPEKGPFRLWAQEVDARVFIQTRAQLEALVVPSPGVTGGVTVLNTALGQWHYAGVSEPTGIPEAGYVQTADGSWWVARGDLSGAVEIEHFGATGDGLTDDIDAILDGVDFAIATGVPLRFPSPLGYAISDQILLDNANLMLIGAGPARPTFHALATAARIAVGRAGFVRLKAVNFSGLHPGTGVVTAINAFISLPRGGRDAGITGSNSFTLDQCIGSNTRGSTLVVDRDSTETRVWGCSLRRAGRVDEDGEGSGRFPDGEASLVEWRGNGSIVNSTLSGCTGYGIDVSAGPPDAFGVFEEVHLRARNVRVQTSFKGLWRVRDWLGGTRTSENNSNRPVSMVWQGGYMENPGTVQDSTTSGGSNVVQLTGDDVVVGQADGANVHVLIDAPVKIQSRRANSGFRVRQGAHVEYRGAGQEWRAQQSLTSGAVMFDVGTDTRLTVDGMPDFRSETDGGAIDELGGASRPMLSAFIKRTTADPSHPVIFARERKFLTLLDGTSIAPIVNDNGVKAVTVSTASGAVLTGDFPASVVLVEARNDGSPTPKFIDVDFIVPPALAGRWIGLRSRVKFQQTGAVFGGTGQSIRHALQFAEVSGATVTHATERSDGWEPSAPGAGNWTEWGGEFRGAYVKTSGLLRARCFLTTRTELSDDFMAVNRLWVTVLDGSGLAF